MKLTKFPVTAPDGTEYRVKIREEMADFWGRCMVVSISVRTKSRRFKRVRRRLFAACSGDYDLRAPDYVSMASIAVREYAERSALKRSTIEIFAAWDGRITLNGEES